MVIKCLLMSERLRAATFPGVRGERNQRLQITVDPHEWHLSWEKSGTPVGDKSVARGRKQQPLINDSSKSGGEDYTILREVCEISFRQIRFGQQDLPSNRIPSQGDLTVAITRGFAQKRILARTKMNTGAPGGSRNLHKGNNRSLCIFMSCR